LDEAIKTEGEALQLAREHFGPEDDRTIDCIANLAYSYEAAGRIAEALPLYEESRKLNVQKRGPDHFDTLSDTYFLALACRLAGEFDRALALLQDTLHRRRATLGPQHPFTLDTLNELAKTHDAAGEFPAAESMYRELLTLVSAEHPQNSAIQGNLGLNLLRQEKFAAAEPLLLEVHKKLTTGRQPQVSNRGPDLTAVVHGLVKLYTATDKLEQAARWRSKLESQADQVATPDRSPTAPKP
jgi:tetratricopeptide (TPR) repeat protein